MTCIAIALGVLGIAAMRRAHHRYHGHAGWYGPFGHGCHGPAGMYGRRHGRKRMMLHALFMRIDATPAQERAIVHEFEKSWVKRKNLIFTELFEQKHIKLMVKSKK